MRNEIEWLDDALSSKDIIMAMTHYRVKDRFMTATNGRIIAGHPCDVDGEFLVPGLELKNIFKRLPDEPKVTVKEDQVILRSGKFSGTLQMLPGIEWTFPELGNPEWKKFPIELLSILRDLRPFVSENAVHLWSMGIAIDHGWCYASNNVALAGAAFPAGRNIQALIPSWVVDFLMQRFDGLKYWAVTETYMAFKWDDGAWMRSTLIDSKFPERAGEMIRETPRGTQLIGEDYRRAVVRVAELTDPGNAVYVYKDHVKGSTKRSMITEQVKSDVPEDKEYSLWEAQTLGLVIGVARAWSPALWPKPVPFHGERVKGYILGRVA